MLRVSGTLICTTLLLTLFALACSGAGDADRPAAALQQTDTSGFQVVSAKFSEIRPKTRIPLENSCYGENLSPPLSWDEAPEGTRSLALIADEPENELGPWVHWVVYNIPAGVTELAPAMPTTTDPLPDGTKQGLNDSKGIGYAGPCPPRLILAYTCASETDFVRPPKYVFRLYALDAELELAGGATRAELEKAMEGHVLGQAETAGKFTTSLGVSTKEGQGFMNTTGGRSASLTPVNVRMRQGC